MDHLCDAGAKPRPLRLTRDSSARQVGITRNTSTSGTEQMTTLSILAIGTRHGESSNR